jgi:hypothetical protein
MLLRQLQEATRSVLNSSALLWGYLKISSVLREMRGKVCQWLNTNERERDIKRRVYGKFVEMYGK